MFFLEIPRFAEIISLSTAFPYFRTKCVLG